MPWKRRVATVAKYLGIFVAIGPPAGGLAFFAGIGLVALVQNGDVAGLLWIFLFGLIYGVPMSYLLGAIPAAVAGLAVGLAATCNLRPGLWLATAVGLAVGIGLVLAGGRPLFAAVAEGGSDNLSAVLLVATCVAATLAATGVARAVIRAPEAPNAESGS